MAGGRPRRQGEEPSCFAVLMAGWSAGGGGREVSPGCELQRSVRERMSPLSIEWIGSSYFIHDGKFKCHGHE